MATLTLHDTSNAVKSEQASMPGTIVSKDNGYALLLRHVVSSVSSTVHFRGLHGYVEDGSPAKTAGKPRDGNRYCGSTAGMQKKRKFTGLRRAHPSPKKITFAVLVRW